MEKRKYDLSRDDWIAAGMRALYDGGIGAVKADRLAKQMQITRGSFYWHFKNLDDFLNAMVAFWLDVQQGHLARLQASKEDAETQLKNILSHIHAKNAEHDVAMRLWAYQDENVARAVQKIDRLRLKYVESLFRTMGLDQEQARFRAHMLYYFQLGDQLSRKRPTHKERAAHFEQLKQMLLKT